MYTRPGFLAAASALAIAVTQTPAFAQTPAEYAETAAYAAAHQNTDGGFAAKPGQKSSLGATNSGLKVLLHVGGSVPDILGCVKYVKSCRDSSGGFAPEPGGKPDVVTTAIGLMAASELKIADAELVKAAIDYLRQERQDVRGGPDGHRRSRSRPRTLARFSALARADQQPSRARRNVRQRRGQGVCDRWRCRGDLAHGNEARKPRRDHQRDQGRPAQEGAWSKEDGPPDLGATYRVMRALYMLREKPDVDRLLSFIKRCRQSDGSYASSPGGTGDLGGTYTATIITRWVRLLSGLPAVTETAGFTPLVAPKDLTGWEGDKDLWSVSDGVLGRPLGRDQPQRVPGDDAAPIGDFVLSLNFRMIDGKGNSGVQFRSVRVPNREMSGYQADIGEGFWGCLYDESRRNKVLVPASETSLEGAQQDRLEPLHGSSDRAIRSRRAWAEPASVDYRETEPSVAQIRAAGGADPRRRSDGSAVQGRDDSRASDARRPRTRTGPGFHLRTVKTEQGERKYTVYVPEGYDGSKIYPVILFLHGAGERGQDGIVPAQVGLGPAILHRPGGVPADRRLSAGARNLGGRFGRQQGGARGAR